MATRSAVIVDAVRSPIGRGRPDGALAGVHAVDLLSQVFTGLMERNDVDPSLVEDVIVGCVSQVNEQGSTPGRWAWLGAGYPESVPATTIDRRCGSSQQAADFGAFGVMAGAYDLVVAGGIESMSRVPMGSARTGADPFGPLALQRYQGGLVPQGIGAELIAARWGLDRDHLDAYAARSHERAAKVADAGDFEREIVPIDTGDGQFVSADETIRRGTTVERLAGLPAVFEDQQLAERFPEIAWRITAGNASQISDGASAMLIASEEAAERLGLRPLARFTSFAVVGTDPITMLTGPLPATHKILDRSGMSIDAFDHVEVNEAFAPVPLAWQQEFDADPECLNPCGGAIALGHPLGASGTRLMTTAVHALQRSGGRYALVTMCEGGGMANATILERI